MTELASPTSKPDTSVPTQKPDQSNTQEPPVAQEKASDVIQNTGPEGEGLYDSATGQRLISTEDQLYSKNTKKGDRVVDPLASQLQAFARGETN